MATKETKAKEEKMVTIECKKTGYVLECEASVASKLLEQGYKKHTPKKED